MKDTIDAFKAIGEPTRFRALRILVEAGVELCACEIIDVLQKPQYTISKCLGTLVDARLIDERREGRMMMYSLANGPINDALFKAIAKAPLDKDLRGDSKRLASRLDQREGGACVSGC
jgi:ArsR family transcriptional regulator